MKLVKLNAIDSTNNFLKNLVKETTVENWTVIQAENQTSGRGQFKNSWQSESGKNLTFSVLCELANFKADKAFYINCCVSLAVFKVLSQHIPEKLSIKWPNDILSHSKKICGILTENVVKNDLIVRTVIGVGLNVNQEVFSAELSNATSMKLVTEVNFDRTRLLKEIVKQIKAQVRQIEAKNFETIKKNYETHLFRINTAAMYENTLGNQFLGRIDGIDHQGRLRVALENDSVQSFDLKEIRFI